MVHKILHWFGVLFSVLIILAVIGLSLIFTLNPYIQRHQQQIQNIAENLLQNPVKFEQVEVSAHGFEPVLELRNFALLDKNTDKPLFQMEKLEIGVDMLGSLFKWQIMPGLLVIDGTKINVARDADGKFFISNLNHTTNINQPTYSDEFYKKFEWLLLEGKIVIKNSSLMLLKSDNTTLNIKLSTFALSNNVFYRELSAKGVMEQQNIPTDFVFKIKYHGNLINRQIFSISGDVDLNNLVLNAQTEFKNDFDFLIPQTGHIDLHVSNVKFTNDNLFRQPLAIDDFFGNVKWQHSDIGWQFNAKDLHIRNKQLDIKGTSDITFPVNGQSPIVKMKLNFNGKDIARAKLYYPAKIMDKELLDWMDHAFIDGKSVSGRIILDGALQDFPFDNKNGRFYISANVHDVKFNYYENWPIFENLNGNIIFDGRSMRIKAYSGKIVGTNINYAEANIADLAKAILQVDGLVNTDSFYGVRFLASSPLKDIFGDDLSKIQLHGIMQLGLKLSIPLDDSIDQPLQVDGNIKLQNNILKLIAWNVELDTIQGNLNFTKDSVTSDNLSAKLFDKPLAIKVFPAQDANKQQFTQVKITGNFDTLNLKQMFDVDLSNYIYGATDFIGSLQFFAKPNNLKNNLHIQSNLYGIGVKLPEPFGKTEISNKQFALDFNYEKVNPSMVLNYGDNFGAALNFERSVDKLKLNSGHINIGKSAANIQTVNKARGLVITGNLDNVNWNDWSSFMMPKPGTNNFSVFKKSIQLSLNINQLNIFDQVLKLAKITAISSTDNLSISVVSPKITGNINIPNNYPQRTLKCNFQKLYIDKKQQPSSQSISALTPHDLAAFYLSSDDFRYGNTSFGKVVLSTSVLTSKTNTLNINKFMIGTSTYNLDASGTWQKLGEENYSNFKGKVTSTNVGDALKQLDLTQSLEGGTGRINFTYGWRGIFYDPNLNTGKGHFNIQIENGRIINLGTKTETEMGLGRVLSILSLQTLPRRLTLDFSDLVKAGFSFDILKGDFRLDSGSVTTNNTALDGTVAKVSMTGRIGLQAKDFDMHLTVYPKITSSLPIIATVAGGPIAGAVTWLADKVILSQGVGQITSYKYKVTGSWLKPNIQ